MRLPGGVNSIPAGDGADMDLCEIWEMDTPIAQAPADVLDRRNFDKGPATAAPCYAALPTSYDLKGRSLDTPKQISMLLRFHWAVVAFALFYVMLSAFIGFRPVCTLYLADGFYCCSMLYIRRCGHYDVAANLLAGEHVCYAIMVAYFSAVCTRGDSMVCRQPGYRDPVVGFQPNAVLWALGSVLCVMAFGAIGGWDGMGR